jgi:hypothetical protein
MGFKKYKQKYLHPAANGHDDVSNTDTVDGSLSVCDAANIAEVVEASGAGDHADAVSSSVTVADSKAVEGAAAIDTEHEAKPSEVISKKLGRPKKIIKAMQDSLPPSLGPQAEVIRKKLGRLRKISKKLPKSGNEPRKSGSRGLVSSDNSVSHSDNDNVAGKAELLVSSDKATADIGDDETSSVVVNRSSNVSNVTNAADFKMCETVEESNIPLIGVHVASNKSVCDSSNGLSTSENGTTEVTGSTGSLNDNETVYEGKSKISDNELHGTELTSTTDSSLNNERDELSTDMKSSSELEPGNKKRTSSEKPVDKSNADEDQSENKSSVRQNCPQENAGEHIFFCRYQGCGSGFI